MLVLARKVGESVKIGDDIFIRVIQVKGKQVRIGIEAPKEKRVLRGELNNSNDKTIASSSTELKTQATADLV